MIVRLWRSARMVMIHPHVAPILGTAWTDQISGENAITDRLQPRHVLALSRLASFAGRVI